MASLADVAREAGVSVATASMVLNRSKGAERISDACAAHVREVARRLDYVPNYHMQSVRRGRAEVIGFVWESGALREYPLESSFFHSMLAGAETATYRAGFDVVRIRPDGERPGFERAVRRLRQRRIDAFIVPVPVRTDLELLRAGSNVPIVVIEPRVEVGVPVIDFDAAAGIRLAVEHLVRLGHRKLLWFGPLSEPTARIARVELFRQAVAGADVECQLWDHPKDDERAEELIANRAGVFSHRLLNEGLEATGIVTYNDISAIAACRALNARGYDVPGDVSVVGFDDEYASFCVPPLTSVSQELFQIGRRACELALEMVMGGEDACRRLQGYRETIQPLLRIRDSSGPPKG